MLPDEKLKQYGFARTEEDVKCIILHNTSSSLSAEELYQYLSENKETTQGCHYLVDHNEVIQVMPHNWGCYNCGQAKDYSAKYGIAIEICSNIEDDLYLAGQDKAIELIKQLMKNYSIAKSEIYFHNDFNKKSYCPSDIIRIYGTKKKFLDTFIN